VADDDALLVTNWRAGLIIAVARRGRRRNGVTSSSANERTLDGMIVVPAYDGSRDTTDDGVASGARFKVLG
jgi:hypothetical protein